FPALTDVAKRLQPAQIKEKISKGGGLMPPFPQLSPQEIDDIASYLAH
ncbi:MAG: cytochrome c, partial [Stenotrophomonas maltophilia]